MFTPHFFIDTLQSTKKTVFNSIVKDQQLQQIATNYVDAQTVFAKMLVDNTISVATHSFDSLKNYWFPKDSK